ncbi:hypothetical protein C2845_PM05G02300 [Panicum miliaceum]|uniref:Uncharacterized protein n=1 Tax=Panicum miliaceum TaxID=4540 RepID=A0A3L6T0V6_PANMI|nr:hypothetical protein C2845_PM05G02300 [Panicum miliaceum]
MCTNSILLFFPSMSAPRPSSPRRLVLPVAPPPACHGQLPAPPRPSASMLLARTTSAAGAGSTPRVSSIAREPLSGRARASSPGSQAQRRWWCRAGEEVERGWSKRGEATSIGFRRGHKSERNQPRGLRRARAAAGSAQGELRRVPAAVGATSVAAGPKPAPPAAGRRGLGPGAVRPAPAARAGATPAPTRAAWLATTACPCQPRREGKKIVERERRKMR